MTPGQRLRDLISREEILPVAGVHDALAARLAERAGFRAVYMTGGGTANALTGLPDIGLVTMTESVMNLRYIAAAVDVPVVADADTGYGNAINVVRTVREYEHAGAAALHLEDQAAPKRCGHVSGKECVSIDEMVGKVRAAVGARRDPDFVIIARIDARQPLGLEAAVERGLACRQAGADMVFPEALESEEEFARYREAVSGPLMANMTEFGQSPLLSAPRLQHLGYQMVIFPVSGLRVALWAMERFYSDLLRDGSQESWIARMMPRRDLYDLVEYGKYTKLEREYLGHGVDPLL